MACAAFPRTDINYPASPPYETYGILVRGSWIFSIHSLSGCLTHESALVVSKDWRNSIRASCDEPVNRGLVVISQLDITRIRGIRLWRVSPNDSSGVRTGEVQDILVKHYNGDDGDGQNRSVSTDNFPGIL